MTEGQTLVTSGLEAVITYSVLVCLESGLVRRLEWQLPDAGAQVRSLNAFVLIVFREVFPGLPAACRDGCEKGLVECRPAG